MRRRIGAAVEANIAIEGVPDLLKQGEIQLFRHGVLAVEVADSGGEGIDAGGINEGLGTFGRGECLAQLNVVDSFGMQIGAAAEVVRFALDQGASSLGVLDDFLGGRNDLFVGGIVIGIIESEAQALIPKEQLPGAGKVALLVQV